MIKIYDDKKIVRFVQNGFAIIVIRVLNQNFNQHERICNDHQARRSA